MEIYEMAGHLIRRLHQISTQVFMRRAEEAGFDLTPVQYAAMGAISAQPGIDQARVAALIAYDRATIGGVLDRLQKKGYVCRSVNPRDRRARELSLSPLGQEVFEALSPVVLDMQTEMLEALDESERTDFIAMLGKIVKEA